MPVTDGTTDVLFISEHPLWPLDQGFRIRGYHMSHAIQSLGYRVACASLNSTRSALPGPLRSKTIPWPEANDDHVRRFERGWSGRLANLRRRVAEHQALDRNRLAGVIALVDRHRPKIVIGLGQHAPITLAGITHEHGCKTIWYAADDPVRFELSCLRREGPAAAPQRFKKAALYAALERLFVPCVDGVVAVSPTDTTILRAIGGPPRRPVHPQRRRHRLLRPTTYQPAEAHPHTQRRLLGPHGLRTQHRRRPMVRRQGVAAAHRPDPRRDVPDRRQEPHPRSTAVIGTPPASTSSARSTTSEPSPTKPPSRSCPSAAAAGSRTSSSKPPPWPDPSSPRPAPSAA